MSDELMPCPFCGKDKISISKFRIDEVINYSCNCMSCDSEGPSSYNKLKAIEKWNTRNGVEYKHTPEPEGEDNSGTVITR